MDKAQNSPLARRLNIVLSLAIYLLAFMCLGLVAMAVLMMFPNGLRQDLLTQAFEVDISISPRSFSLIWVSGAIMVGGYLSVVYILRAVVRTLLAGDPFVPENISRLRYIWIILAALEVFRMGVHLKMGHSKKEFAHTQVDEHLSSSVASSVEGVVIDINITAWFLVFVIAALAEVFRHGAELRRDQKLTV